jgi:hypothetical protein
LTKRRHGFNYGFAVALNLVSFGIQDVPLLPLNFCLNLANIRLTLRRATAFRGGDGLVSAKQRFTVIRGRGRPRPFLESNLVVSRFAKFLFEIRVILANIRPRFAMGNGALESRSCSFPVLKWRRGSELKIHETYASLQ